MALARESILDLFNNRDNPTRLVQPAGGVAIDVAISAADVNLYNVRLAGLNSNEVQRLEQLLDFAKGLQLLQPYFTDLTMDQVTTSVQIADLSITNSSINALGITNSRYIQILNDLMALVASNAAQSIVFLLNRIHFNIVFFNYLEIFNLFLLNFSFVNI